MNYYFIKDTKVFDCHYHFDVKEFVKSHTQNFMLLMSFVDIFTILFGLYLGLCSFPPIHDTIGM